MSKRLLMVFLWGASLLSAQVGGVDSGSSAAWLATWDADLMADWGQTGAWLRIRARPDPMDPAQQEALATELDGLARLCDWGFRPVPFLRWSPKSWPGGVREAPRSRLPLDLREAYDRGFAYGRAYAGVVAAMEVENEPDIGFVAENPATYMAFQKAMYLGLTAGFMAAEEAKGKAEPRAGEKRLGRPADRWANAGWRAEGVWNSENTRTNPEAHRAHRPLAVMAPLAMPPGPYFEQLVANGLLSYTDAFNYHYYGYAEDFTGVYRQFRAAVRAFGGRKSGARDEDGAFGWSDREASLFVTKSLPVMLTEYGYGSLGESQSAIKEARVRQWDWFRSVGQQVYDLRVAAPMAFYVPPYNEVGLEFGLTIPINPEQGAGDPFKVSGLTFTPSDFGLSQTEPWMREIGRRLGGNGATPAWAWLYDYGRRHPYQPVNWTVSVPVPSPIVLDMLAKEGAVAVKRYGGYLLLESGPPVSAGGGAPVRKGRVDLVVYNFSDQPVRGRLVLREGRELLADPEAMERERALSPRERLVIPLEVRAPAARFQRHRLVLGFAPLGRGPKAAANTVFATSFYPEASRLQSLTLYDFQATSRAAEAANKNRSWLLRRSLASEEPRLTPVGGGWLGTKGVEVAAPRPGVWRFTVSRYPEQPMKPAMAELPLPDGFVFPDDAMLTLDYRLVDEAGLDDEGRFFDLYFRTANGNLYQVWPRQLATKRWKRYTEIKRNFSMAFYGRAALPWRFADNKPVSLVLYFRPRNPPLAYEIRRMRLVEFKVVAPPR